MSLITKFLLPELEKELMKYEPELLQMTEDDLKDIVNVVINYLEQKLKAK